MHRNKGCRRPTGADDSSSKVSISGRKEADINKSKHDDFFGVPAGAGAGGGAGAGIN